MRAFPPLPIHDRRYLFRLGVLFLCYVITARIGLSLYAVHDFATLVWPPTGIALAVLFLFGYELWPAVFLGAFIVNAWVGAPIFAALGIGIGNALEAVVGAYLFRHFARAEADLVRLSCAVGMIVAVFSASIISASIGVFSLWLADIVSTADITTTWGAWWFGDALGGVVVAPFLIRWLPQPFFKRTPVQTFEILAALTVLGATGWILFWSSFTEFSGISTLYLIFIPLVWIALRLGPRIMTLALLMTAVLAVLGTIFGEGASIATPTSQSLFLTQLLVGVIAVVFLLFVSLEEERKEATGTLGQHVRELERALRKIRSEDRAKGEFLAILAHELRNPLSPIVSSLELMRVNGIREINRRLIETIETHTTTMRRILDDLLDVTRLTRKKLSLEKELLDARDVVRHSIGTTETVMRAQRHALEISLPRRAVVVEADPVRLGQIIVNLLTNAAKYTNPGGRVRLELLAEHECAIIRVRDSGIGIAPEHLDRIFDSFVQIRGSGGLGIGLSLTKQLTEMHGGKIHAWSAGLGQGSEFAVTLPLSRSGITPLPRSAMSTYGARVQKKRPRSPVHAKTEDIRGRTILVVDDNEAAAKSLSKLLAHTGHEVECAFDSESVLKRVPLFKPDVVILDIGLPGEDGYTVARKLRESGFRGILLALSGYGQTEDKQKARAAGFDWHLTKPVGLVELTKAMNVASSGVAV